MSEEEWGGMGDGPVYIGDAPSQLSFDRPAILGTSVRATLQVPGLTASRVIEVAGRDDLASFFRELSEAWRGWDGARTYVAPDADLRLECYHDHRREVEVLVTLGGLLSKDDRDSTEWSATGWVRTGIGALDRVATDLRRLFDRP